MSSSIARVHTHALTPCTYSHKGSHLSICHEEGSLIVGHNGNLGKFFIAYLVELIKALVPVPSVGLRERSLDHTAIFFVNSGYSPAGVHSLLNILMMQITQIESYASLHKGSRVRVLKDHKNLSH